VDPSGRPLAPELFITDLSVNGAGSRAGDWQQGGTGIAPHRVCGVWKGAAVLIDQTVTPAKVTVTTASDPAKNNWSGIPDTPPGGFAALTNQGYGAECSWNVDELGLIAGHTYRLQFMVHDGDQNKTGGDVGEACTTAHIPQTGPCVPVIAVVAGGGPAAAMQAPGGEEAAGQAQGSEPAAQGPAIADGLELYRPTPNPFRETMRFAYAVSGPEAQPVRVGVYDVTGRQIRQLAAGLMVPGRYQSRWDGRNDGGTHVGGGIYFVRVVAGGKQVAFRVLYLK